LAQTELDGVPLGLAVRECGTDWASPPVLIIVPCGITEGAENTFKEARGEHYKGADGSARFTSSSSEMVQT
jgi:hypothetical protein